MANSSAAGSMTSCSMSTSVLIPPPVFRRGSGRRSAGRSLPALVLPARRWRGSPLRRTSCRPFLHPGGDPGAPALDRRLAFENAGWAWFLSLLVARQHAAAGAFASIRHVAFHLGALRVRARTQLKTHATASHAAIAPAKTPSPSRPCSQLRSVSAGKGVLHLRSPCLGTATETIRPSLSFIREQICHAESAI